MHDFDMSQQAPKRLRSQSRDSITTATSEIGPESTVSRESKYSIYQDARYPALLESQGSHMGESASGLLADELAACESLFTSAVTLPSEPLLKEGRFRRFLGVLENKSELRVCIDLHPRLVPSAELLSLHSEGPFGDIVDGYNDRWTKAMVFYKKLPQPDRTVAFRESALTDEQRSKLAILPEVNSLFSVREGMCFPFLTCEVKCGKQALELADRSNANSMTIATRARVELYRRAGRLADIHRRVSGFSISHDDKSVRIYAHYAEVFGERPLYYRYLLRAFDCRDKNGQDRWTTYQFVINVYTHFAPQHLKNLRSIIDEIPSSMMRSMDSTVTANDLPGDSDSQEIPGTASTSQQGDGFVRPESIRGRTTVKQQLQQMQEDARAREQRLTEQLEKQRIESQAQLIQQLEKQRQESQAQISQLEALYKQQSSLQEQRHKEQMARQEKQTAKQEKRYTDQIDLLKSLLPGR